MSKVIRVRYEGGVLKPLEPVELSEGEHALVIIKRSKLVELARNLRREARVSIDKLIEEVRDRGETSLY